MSLFYRIIIVLLVIASGYSLFGIIHFKRMYHVIENPSAEFQIKGNLNGDVTLVEFFNYRCSYCKELDPIINELLNIRKDVRFVARPIAFSYYEGGEGAEVEIPDTLTKMVLAAGLQGKFWEMHSAILEYPSYKVPDEFIQETAALYDINYDQMIKDAEGKKVQKLLSENRKALDYTSLNTVPAFLINKKFYVVTEDKLPDLKKLLEIIASSEEK